MEQNINPLEALDRLDKALQTLEVPRAVHAGIMQDVQAIYNALQPKQDPTNVEA